MRILLFLLLATASFLQAAKTPPLTIRLHAEAGPEEGKSFVTPVTLISPHKETYIRKVPIVTENDILAFHAFPAKDGSIAAYLQLDPDGTHKLEGHTTAFRDTVVVILINGRVASALRVDKKITDGILYVPSGLLPKNILQMQARFPAIGKEKDFKEQKKQATLALKQQALQEKAAAQAEKASPTPAPQKEAVRSLLLVGVLLAACRAAWGQAAPLVDFPTANHNLLQGRPQDFFMYVERDFEGEKSQPWQGGQYGFVRGPHRANGQVIYASMHEGIDIRPLQRGVEGNPLDPILAAADGRVVHASREAGASNYGRYVVIEHLWNGCPYYTLYAHLASISVEPGQSVKQGQPIAVMGFTGAGINRERAHVHFEVCMMLSRNFDAWHEAFYKGTPNRHGLFNGLNLAGTDPARLLLEARENPSFRIADAFSAGEPSFKITINNSPDFSLIRNYPWLVPQGEIANPPAWTIAFSRHGVPLKAEAAMNPVPEPTVTWVKETGQAYIHSTKGLVSGSTGHPRLTESGMRFARLLTWPN